MRRVNRNAPAGAPVCEVNYTSWKLRCPSELCSAQPVRCSGLQEMDVSSLASDLELIRQFGGGSVGFTRTVTTPSFVMAVSMAVGTASEVSYHVGLEGFHERQYTELWHRLTSECCAEDGGLVLDVGANLGYYALYAARIGCRVVAWEPIPLFQAFLRASAAANRLTRSISLRHSLASDTAGSRTMVVPRTGWDISSVDGLNQANHRLHPTWQTIRATAERIDDVVVPSSHQRICALKLDAEGYEPAVVRGAQELLRSTPPRVLLVEYNPGAVERRMAKGQANATTGEIGYLDYPRMLQAFQSAGVRLWLLAGRFKHQQLAASARKVAQLREVDVRNVAAELASARHIARIYSSGAHVAIPWDVHPLSLRAAFAYNTDLVGVHRSVDASRIIATVSPVGIEPNSSASLGGYECRKLAPAVQRMGLCYGDGSAIDRAVEHVEARRHPIGRHAYFPDAPLSAWGNALGGGATCWWQGGCLMRREPQPDRKRQEHRKTRLPPSVGAALGLIGRPGRRQTQDGLAEIRVPGGTRDHTKSKAHGADSAG